MEKMLTISQAAGMLGVSIDTLRRWAKLGKLVPSHVTLGKHRLYRKIDLEKFMEDLFALGETWATASHPVEPMAKFYCRLKPTFQSRTATLQDELKHLPEFAESFSLIVGIVGEIGNNSFDHNLGNWPDIPGIYFGYDLRKRRIILADRGRGVLTTLQVVRPSLSTHTEALRVAFSEVLSGRAPENRGNGLKFVRGIVEERKMKLVFRSGDAEITFDHGRAEPEIRYTPTPIQGCLVFIEF